MPRLRADRPRSVQVWALECKSDGRFDPEGSCASNLSGEERARGRAMQSDFARRSFLAGRALLRLVLGRHLQCAASNVPLRLDSRGKPCLASGGPPFFSLSHAWPYITLTISLEGETGIDVE